MWSRPIGSASAKARRSSASTTCAALRVRHIASLLKTLGIERAHFIGNSMGGGMLASVAAQDQPVWPIEKMILASAGGFAPGERRAQGAQFL